MPTEKDAIPGKAKDTSSRPQKQRPTSPESQELSLTTIESSEFVVSGPGANININKASYQDFIDIHKYAYEQGHDAAIESLEHKDWQKDLGEDLLSKKEQSNAEPTSKSLRSMTFISYSRPDKKYLNELRTHLAPYVRNDMIRFWDDTVIKPGTKWLEEIKKGLQSAKVAVFLVSPEFLASDFIATKELPPLLTAASEEGVVILSVILLPCGFKHCPLAQFQAVNDPSNPLSDMTKGKRNAVWVRVAECIKDS